MMKKTKVALDVLMTVLMILLMKTNTTGLQLHEIIGIFIFVLFLVHKILNLKFINAIGKNLFNKKLKATPKILFWFDVVLLVFMAINVFSGILISRYVLKFISASDYQFVTSLHKSFAWWTLILISIHIGLHLNRLTSFCTKKIPILKSKKIAIVILIIYLIIAMFGVASLNKYSIYSKMIPVNSTQDIGYEHIEKEYKNHSNYNGKNKGKNNGKNNGKKESRPENESSQNNADNDDIPTLEEYLSQFQCDGCGKGCSLLNPRCEIGRAERDEKISEYYEKYGSNENQDSGNKKGQTVENTTDNNVNRKYKNKSNLFDVISIMILFASAAYYLRALLMDKMKK